MKPLLAIIILGTLAFGQTARSIALKNTETIPATLFGMHFRLDKIAWPQIPFGSLRLWDTETDWQKMNPAAGVYDFSSLDAYLVAAHANGLKDVVLTLSGTPRFISSDPNNALCDYGRDSGFAFFADGSCGVPTDLEPDGTGTNQIWRDFISALALHIKSLDPATHSTIKYFEMWNEFTRGTSEDPSSWEGSNAQLVRLSQDANCILTGHGKITATGEPCDASTMKEPAVGLLPAAKILAPSAVPQPPDVAILGSYLRTAGAVRDVDAIAVHAYCFRSGSASNAMPDSNSTSRGPGCLPASYAALRAVSRGAGATTPVWSTEGSWALSENLANDDDLMKGYVARYYLVGWSVGFKRLYWYAADNSYGRLINQSGVGGCSGPLNGCNLPAATAWTQVYSWMVGNKMTSPCQSDSSRNVWTCALKKPNGTKMLAVWDSSKSCSSGACTTSAYNYPAGMRYAKYYTLDNSAAVPLVGPTVRIGWKPILLSP